jgi:hypothetical protein
MYYCLTVTVLFLWDALCDGRAGLSFVYAAGPRQRSLFSGQSPFNMHKSFAIIEYFYHCLFYNFESDLTENTSLSVML